MKGSALATMPGEKCGLLVFWLMLQAWPGTAVSVDLVAKEAELSGLRARIRNLQIDLEQDHGEMNELRRQLMQSEREIGYLLRSLKELAATLSLQEQRLGWLERRRQELQAELDGQSEVLGSQIRAAYAMGRQERLKILLNQQNPDLLSRVFTYYHYLNRARAAQIQAVQLNLRQLAHTEQELVIAKEQLAAIYRQQQAQKMDLETKREDREALITALAADIQGKSEQLGELRAGEEQLHRLLESLHDTLADIPMELDQRVAFQDYKGKLPWPSQGRIVANFGTLRQVGTLRWEGVVIAAAKGDMVRVVSRGRVAFADWLRGFGLLTIIDHGDGYMSLYGYNESLYKEIGDWVEAGEPIASVGNSGGRRQASLYFEIRHKGRPVNPVHWCVRRIGAVGNREVPETLVAGLKQQPFMAFGPGG